MRTNLADEYYGIAIPTTARLIHNLQVSDRNGSFDSFFEGSGVYRHGVRGLKRLSDNQPVKKGSIYRHTRPDD